MCCKDSDDEVRKGARRARRRLPVLWWTARVAILSSGATQECVSIRIRGLPQLSCSSYPGTALGSGKWSGRLVDVPFRPAEHPGRSRDAGSRARELPAANIAGREPPSHSKKSSTAENLGRLCATDR
jgi:hypothetical protein